MDIALITCRDVPQLDNDDALLIPALAIHGLHAQPVIWNDPGVDWSKPRLSVIRSTWDYHHQRDAFLEWAKRISTFHSLWNPYPLLEWNTHKFYLQDLQQAGIAIIPTIYLKSNTSVDLALLMAEQEWQAVVIKPAVSANAYATLLVTLSTLARGQHHLYTFLPTHDMLIQPFMSSVTTSGERSLIFIDGVFTHAIKRKHALGQDLAQPDISEEGTPTIPTLDEIQLAQSALATLQLLPLYARIDIVRDDQNQPRLMELELVEPWLGLGLSHIAVERMAATIARYNSKTIFPLTN